MKRRVVITGLGFVSPMGHEIEQVLENLKSGYNSISEITNYNTNDMPVKLAAEVYDDSYLEGISPKEQKNNDKFSIFAMVAARKALEDSGLGDRIKNNDRVSVHLGSGVGGIETMEVQIQRGLERGPNRISPYFIPMVISNIGAGNISIDLGINGPAECPVTACASGTNALGNAFRSIRDGYADISFAGGSEAGVTRMSMGGFSTLRAMTTETDPNKACRPFDKDRDGFVMGEGAVILVLEELEMAKERGANIYAELVGYGITSDSYHITATHPEGTWAAKAMENALEDAGLKPSDIDYINCHGTSTPMNDSSEVIAMRKAFGEEMDRIKISSSKSMTGHMLGAAGAMEGAICALAIKNSFIPPNINLENVAEDCKDLNIVKESEDFEIEYAMSNSLGFGGHNLSIIFKRYKND